MPGLGDFDRYVAEHGIPREHYPVAFALWIAEVSGGQCRTSSVNSRFLASSRTAI